MVWDENRENVENRPELTGLPDNRIFIFDIIWKVWNQIDYGIDSY